MKGGRLFGHFLNYINAHMSNMPYAHLYRLGYIRVEYVAGFGLLPG